MMSTPDYDQFAEDHQCLLIVIKQIGPQINPSLFNLIYERLSQLYEFKITDNKGMGFERTVRLRYKQSYSIENNDWGDFQAHRRLVGLITIARSFNDNEIESICELHNTIRDTYANTLFDSRCFVIRNSPSSTEGVNHKLPELPASNQKTNDGDDKSLETESFSENYPLNHNESQLFEFPIGDPLCISSNHTNFSTHLNRSSSSSSDSSQISWSLTSSPNRTVKPSHQYNQDVQPSSLPFISENYNSTRESGLSDSSTATLGSSSGLHSQTHSRHKSLDSRLLTTTSTGHPNLEHSSSTIANRTHSTSSSSLFKSSSRENMRAISSTASEYIRYESEEQCCEQIELRVREFITGLFWVLESKRLDRASEKMDKIPLLTAPFEKKDFIGLDTDTRSFRRKCMGRMRKHIADLSLLAGLPQESLTNYNSAIEQLKAVGDKLWLASAYEGVCAASLAILYPNRWHQIHSLRRQFHFEKSIFNDLISRCDYEVARTEVSNYMKRIAERQSSFEVSNCDDGVATVINKSILSQDQFYERYKEAASHYAMYRGAAILEFECSFKAARTLIFFERYLRASDFIQNAVFITFTQSIEEQIERLLQISQLYENIHFYRKAAFYKRFAALKSVSLHVKNPNWEKCYFLLLPSLYGYGINLDPNEYDERLASKDINWSGIHVQLMQEMITTALKMQNETLAMRHLSFMIQCLFNHISPMQRQEFATKLSSLASKCGEGSPVILNLSNGAIVPSVNFTKFPTVIFFKVEPLASYLRPIKLTLKSTKESERLKAAQNWGPFIYTPLQLNRSPKLQRITSDSVSKMPFYWTEGNTGKITMSLHNFLPIELNISSITIMTDGVAFEPNHDTSLKIASSTSFTNISLTGIPRATGNLEILGYKIHALGIKSDCRLSQLPNARKLKLPGRFAVEIVPRLPLMCAQCIADDLTCELRSAKGIEPPGNTFVDMHISNSAYMHMFTGQRKTFQMKLSNISRNSDELIDFVEMEVIFPKQMNSLLKQLVTVEWNDEQLNGQLPIGWEHNITFDIVISVKGDFVFQMQPPVIVESDIVKSSKMAANNSLLAQKKSQVLGSTKLANFINELQTKKINNSDLNGINKMSEVGVQVRSKPEFPKEMHKTTMIEFCIQFDYSGGPGLNSGYCRQTSVHFVIEVSPSVLITHWDVLSAEHPDECYLVFDALNATEYELNLLYANKEMLIEPREKCRIPVPIKRCPLNLASFEDELSQMPNRCAYLQCHNPAKQSTSAKHGTDFLSYIFPTDHKLKAILDQTRLHLRAQMSLQWRLSFPGHEGIVSVEQVPYSNEMLKLLLTPPIQSEIQINDLTMSSSIGEAVVNVGEQANIKTRLLNSSETSLHRLRLYMYFYQDYQNPTMTKSRNNNMKSKMVINGCDSICIDQLQSKETYEHSCGLVFIYPGIYKLEICCMPEESFQKTGFHNTETLSCSMLDANSAQSLFTCLHTVEITAVE